MSYSQNIGGLEDVRQSGKRNDYIVDLNKDTFWGKISLTGHTWELTAKSGHSITNSKGKYTFLQKSIYEYRVGNQVFMFIALTDKRGKTLIHRLNVMVMGEFRLLFQMTGLGERYFVHYQNTFYEIAQRHFSDEIWEILIQCPLFCEKYGYYREFHLSSQWTITPEAENEWMNMLKFYNERCALK